MNKMDRNNNRIEIIKNERKEMLKEVQQSLLDDNTNVCENINEVLEMIDFDESNIKKYESIKKAQELIESLTVDIAYAKTKEEVIALRKKINYYINKIKEELKRRNIDYDKYQDTMTLYRKNIAKYLRLLKKEEKIEELEDINIYYDDLTKEEKKKLSKKISNERNYNTRIIRENNNKDKKMKNSDNFLNFKRANPITFNGYNSDDEYISENVSEFLKHYDLQNLNNYGHNIGKNLVTFFKNLPIYNNNKKVIRKMYMDRYYFCRNDAFHLFVDYSKKNNSIIEGLRGIFNKSSLYNKENEYLDNHGKCVNWILLFVKENNIRLNYYKAI